MFNISKGERGVMSKLGRLFPRAKRIACREKKRSEGYDVNSRTLAAFLGLHFFALGGAVLLINATLMLMAYVWVFTFEGYDLLHTALGIAFAAFCFFTALLFRQGFDHCHRTLLSHKLPV